jgi:hypothetical protein
MSWIITKAAIIRSPELSLQAAWQATTCESGMFELAAVVSGQPSHGGLPSPRAILLRVGGSAQERWVLVGDGSIRINGTPLAGGIRVLQHRDEIHVGNNPPVYFSTERPARIEAFPGAERPIRCPRCRLEIRTGDLAVRCGRCGIWHHENEEYPCWTYPEAETCAACQVQPNTLDAGLSWFPEE